MFFFFLFSLWSTHGIPLASVCICSIDLWHVLCLVVGGWNLGTPQESGRDHRDRITSSSVFPLRPWRYTQSRTDLLNSAAVRWISIWCPKCSFEFRRDIRHLSCSNNEHVDGWRADVGRNSPKEEFYHHVGSHASSVLFFIFYSLFWSPGQPDTLSSGTLDYRSSDNFSFVSLLLNAVFFYYLFLLFVMFKWGWQKSKEEKRSIAALLILSTTVEWITIRLLTLGFPLFHSERL